jgi:polar amino acid transport system ATP-binding protein
MANTILEVQNIRKSFDREEVLKGISFSLEEGQVLAIIGSSGSGKTTLLRSLNYLVQPDAGQVYVKGNKVLDAAEYSGMSEADIRRCRLHFGLVFQAFHLFPQYTVLRNITLAAQLQAKEQLLAEKKARKKTARTEKNAEWNYKEALKTEYQRIEAHALELLNQIGLLSKKDAYPCQLSGGQQQRVAIARALAMDPDILCFDEPTSALDPELTGEVLRVIRDLKKAGKTMIVVTHEMEFAKNVADYVIYMANGIIEEEGEPKDVFEKPESEKLRNFLAG